MQQTMIRRTVIDVALSGSESEGLNLQSKLGGMFHDDLTRNMATIFDQLVREDEHWIIDQLTVDVGEFTMENFEHEFAQATALALGRAMKEYASAKFRIFGSRPVHAEFPDDAARKPESNSTTLSKSQSVIRAFTYFLETGVLPWWFKLPAARSLEEEVRSALISKSESASAAILMMQSLALPHARTRLVNQFTPEILIELSALLCVTETDFWKKFLTVIYGNGAGSKLPAKIIQNAWQTIFEILARHQIIDQKTFASTWRVSSFGERDENNLRALIEKFESASLKPERPPVRSKPNKKLATYQEPDRGEVLAKLDLAEGLFVDCAGVVLLHAFVPQLFEALGIAKGEDLVSPDQAMGLLHFLATGELQAPEHALVLAKILCGLELEIPAAAPHALTSKMVQEAEAMLQAAISHWDALGETSIAALRATFLMRPGKLMLRGEEFVLQVETQSFDILFDRLPWGISAVKLPWMKSILWVEWRY
jgi:hypothetical protein